MKTHDRVATKVVAVLVTIVVVALAIGLPQARMRTARAGFQVVTRVLDSLAADPLHHYLTDGDVKNALGDNISTELHMYCRPVGKAEPYSIGCYLCPRDSVTLVWVGVFGPDSSLVQEWKNWQDSSAVLEDDFRIVSRLIEVNPPSTLVGQLVALSFGGSIIIPLYFVDHDGPPEGEPFTMAVHIGRSDSSTSRIWLGAYGADGKLLKSRGWTKPDSTFRHEWRRKYIQVGWQQVIIS